MFDKLRRPGRSFKEGRLKKLFSYFVFGAICLVFVFLAPMGTQLIGGTVIAYVGGEPVRLREFQLVEDNIKRQYQSRLSQADEESRLKIYEEIKQKARMRIIKLYLLVQGSQRAGFSLSDNELRSEIRSFPVFQEKGRFIYSRYLSFLKSQRLNPSRFEEGIRKDKLAQNWLDLFRKSVFSNDLEKQKKSQMYSYKVKIRYFSLPSADIEEANLEPLVKAGDLKKVNSVLKEKDVKWEETKAFSPVLAFGVPIAQNQNLMEVLIQHLPQTGLIPKLIRQADKIYVVDVLSFSKGSRSPQDRQLESFLSRRFDKSARLLDSWIDFQRQRIKVRLSDSL